MALVPIALAAFTAVILVSSRSAPVIVNERLALAIDILAALVAVAVAALGWIRYREAGEEAALWRGSALLVLGSVNGLTATVAMLGWERAFGFGLEDPGQLPLWAAVVPRAVGATLLIVAGLAAISRGRTLALPPVLVLWLPAVAMVGAIVLASGVQGALPALIGPQGLAALHDDPTARLPQGSAAVLGLLQVTIGLGYLAASALSYRAYRLYRRPTDAVLTMGFVLAAFSQVLFAIQPAAYASLVSAGDILRVAFYVTLMTTLAIEVRGDIRALRDANAQLTRLRDAEVARATAEERARLAREIHDGMSQELWYAKLKQGRLLALPSLGTDARQLAEEVSGAIESSLAEARQAIMALRPAEGSSFAEVVERYVHDFSDRFGIPAEARCDAAAEQLAPRTQAELLRIVHEALANVRKHADATLVRVEVGEPQGGQLRVLISDNGRGFAPEQATGSGYGLKSMQQRAAIIGATLTVDSRPQDGTRVTVAVPLRQGAA
ncbi:MAG TPA: sensor histidine kinase [Candidatus Limnocylindria bacterium]|nr:sensor histidine kinase [Candidatus Limnocylindria bacterium]